MTSRRDNDLVGLTVAVSDRVFEVCREWGFERPKVDVVFKVERLTNLVRITFRQKWQIYWETDATRAEELCGFDFEELGETWAQDANVPIAE